MTETLADLATKGLRGLQLASAPGALLSASAVVVLALWMIVDARGRLSVRTSEGRTVLYKDSLEASMKNKVRYLWGFSLGACVAAVVFLSLFFLFERPSFVPPLEEVPLTAYPVLVALIVPCVAYMVMLWGDGPGRSADAALWDFLVREALDIPFLVALRNEEDPERKFAESSVPEEVIDDALVRVRIQDGRYVMFENETDRTKQIARSLFTADYLAYLLGESGAGTRQFASSRLFAQRLTEFTDETLASATIHGFGGKRLLRASDHTRVSSFPNELVWGAELPGGMSGVLGDSAGGVATARRALHDKFVTLAMAAHREGGAAELGDAWWLAVAHMSFLGLAGSVIFVIWAAPHVVRLVESLMARPVVMAPGQVVPAGA